MKLINARFNNEKTLFFLRWNNPKDNCNNFKMIKVKMNRNKKTHFLETVIIVSVLREKSLVCLSVR